jgi:hypothetical protein
MTTVQDVIVNYLNLNGYDGLYNPDLCACKTEDLNTCECINIFDCEPGYIQDCTKCEGASNDWCDGKNEDKSTFCIGPRK